MSLKSKVSFVLLMLSAFVPALFADVKTATVFNSNMVLQREKPVPVWGEATPGEKVQVSFNGQTLSATADASGRWIVTLKSMPVLKDGAEMVVKGEKNTVTFKNVVIGDVWVCSGQSNMEMSFSWGVMDGEKFIKDADNYPLIRRMKVRKETDWIPRDNVPVESPWTVCSSKTVVPFTACGYFFARRIFQETGIPIGIIDDNWSGCRIEPFISLEGLQIKVDDKDTAKAFQGAVAYHKSTDVRTDAGKKRFGDALDTLEKYIADARKNVAAGKVLPKKPATIIDASVGDTGSYNAMIAPIVKYPIAGAIWYQGCSNGNEGISYYWKMHALVDGWRQAWGYDFPFYFVQLAAYTKATDDPAGGNGYARIRDAQRKAMDIPKSGMACTIDIGMQNDIHPKNKFDVGERLALWALRDVYGAKKIVVSGPLYKGMKVEGSKIRLSFDFADGLCTAAKNKYEKPVTTPNIAPKHFAIAGEDRVWHWADAKIEGGEIVVSCDKVAKPVAVRYAYRAYPDGVNVYNATGLPMVPFRTDSW